MPECVNTAELIAAQKAALIRFDIDERLTLAGQPQPDDWTALAAEGFQVVINMRSDPERAAVQQRNAEAAGLQYIHLPLPVYELEADHLEQYHRVMQSVQGRVFLHCRSATRVALMWMLDRIVYMDGAAKKRNLRCAQLAMTMRRWKHSLFVPTIISSALPPHPVGDAYPWNQYGCFAVA